MPDKEASSGVSHLKLRIVLFFVFLAISIGAIAHGISLIGQKDPGLYEVKADPDSDLPYYQSGVTLHYLFTGSGSQIRDGMKALRATYTAALKRSYCLLDAEETHEGYVNLASFNSSPGEEYQVSEPLFRVLCDALEKTNERQGYSIYAGPLYAEWHRILYLENPQEFDPALNKEEGERIRLLVKETAASTTRLVVTDQNSQRMRLDVSDDALKRAEDAELPELFLDLNILHDAYLLRMVADELEEAGFGNGYLTADSGITIVLSGYTDGTLQLYGLTETGVTLAGSAPALSATAASDMRIFPFIEGEYGFYTCEGIFRHPFLTVSGEHANALASVQVISASGDAAGAAYLALRMLAAGTPDEVLELLLSERSESDKTGDFFDAAWTLPGEQMLYTTGMYHAETDFGWKESALDD